MSKFKLIYLKIEKLLIERGYITLSISNAICRRGQRKEWAWRRHVIDMCEFTLSQRGVEPEISDILIKCISLMKMRENEK